MNSALTDIGMTIVQPLFSLAMLLIAVRFLAQLCGVSGYNPISTTLRRVTNVIVLPLSRLLPSGNRFSTGALLALILIQVVFIALMFGLVGQLDAFNVCKHSSGAHSALRTVGQHHLLQCHCDDRREFLSSAKLTSRR